MNGILLLIGIHFWLYFDHSKKLKRCDLIGAFDDLDRSLTQRAYHLPRGPSAQGPLAETLRFELKQALASGNFQQESWLRLRRCFGEWKEELDKMQKNRLVLQSHCLIPALAALSLRLFLGEGSMVFYQPSREDGAFWCLYAGILLVLFRKSPRLEILCEQKIARFLGLWFMRVSPERGEESLRNKEDQAKRLGYSPRAVREEILEDLWRVDRGRFQRRLFLWEELLPGVELGLFFILGVGLCLGPILGLLGDI